MTDKTRSAFLNELDGFAANTGILTLATTNHPERLDPAIRDRPSRFDRKYHFGLPDRPERLAYTEHWNLTVPEPLRLDPEARSRLADRTEGFSFAYLKELFLSAILVRAGTDPDSGAVEPMEAILISQADALRSQMATERRPSPVGDDRDDDDE